MSTVAALLAERERPAGRAAMYQRWRNLLFLHWRWDAAAIQRTLPAGLTVDTFEGRAWLGIVPFFMRGVRPAWCPPVPGISDFLELNVRTYVVDARGRPGVWFYSLDANQWLAVKLARSSFHLPYEHARMSARVEDSSGLTDYRVRRRGAEAGSRFHYGLAAAAPTVAATPGTLEFFLVERYRLFAHDSRRGRLYSGRVYHSPYQMGPADVRAWDDAPLRLDGFESPGRLPDHACYAPGVDVDVFPLEAVHVT
jgi:uncharacterized protein YqjF (DUF2071 family)